MAMGATVQAPALEWRCYGREAGSPVSVQLCTCVLAEFTEALCGQECSDYLVMLDGAGELQF